MSHYSIVSIVRLIALFLLSIMLPITSAQATVPYSEMDKSTLRKKVSHGDTLAMHWLARKSSVLETKALWFEKYAQHETRSLSTSYLAYLYDDEDKPGFKDGEQSYFWYYITDILCKKERYKDRWCADATQRMPELKKELPEDTLGSLEAKAKDWLRKY